MRLSAPPAPTDIRRQPTGTRVAASMNSTCPDATNEMMAWVCDGFIAIMCGRIGLAPVRARHIAAAAPPKSIVSARAVSARWRFSRSWPSQM